MVRDDTTIEDAGKRDHGTGNEIEELNSKSLDAEIEIEGEKLQCDAGGPNKIEDGEGQCLNVSKKEAEDNVTVNNEMEDQTNPERETNEPMPVEGVTGEQINTVSKNEERSNAEEQTVIGQVDDAKNEVVEQHASNGGVEVDKSAENGGVKVEKSGENGVEGGNSVKNVIEEKYADSGVEMENPVKNVIAEKTAEIGVEGENLLENVTAKKNAENGVEEGNPVRNVLEGNNAEENGMKEGNPVKTVLVERNDENCVEGGNVPVKYVIEGNPDIEFKAEKDNNNERKIQNTQFTPDIPSNEVPPNQNSALDKVLTGGDEEMEDTANKGNEVKEDNEDLKEQGKGILRASPVETETKHEGDHSSLPIKHEAAATPSSLVRYLPAKAGDLSGETAKMALMSEGDEGTPEDQAAFMQEIESFYRERAMDFKPPKFYGQPLNCLKLWRAVVRLGGYDRVTGSKLWRQVGESFHPPKTCTTVSWTFRIFYEKSLLEYERHKTQSGELQLPVAALHEASGADTEGNGYQGTGAGRAKRDAASRAMQGWHVQRLFGNGEVGEPAVKDKNIINMAKREKNVKTIGSLKQKRPNEVESSVKVARIETSKQLAITVVDVGPPADWVKVNVRQTKDCFEVYALVPGLLREEVRVQSDPAGRLVITGQPEQVDNPWGIMPFKKVISLPLRIDPLQTSAVVSLHGRLFVRVPFEQSNG